jgi:catecholate siderophore receptor
VIDPQSGDRLIQTPEHAASLFTSYKFPFGLELGYGLNYQGAFALNHRVLAGGVLTPQFRADDYLIHRAFLSYPITPGLTAQLNIQNLTDELYYTGVRNNVNATTGAISGGWATPGDRRSAVLSLFYSF